MYVMRERWYWRTKPLLLVNVWGPLRCPCHQVPTRSLLSAVWAVHASVWLETEVLGCTCQHWVRDISVGCTGWCSAQNIGVGLYMLALHTHLGNPSWGVSCSWWLSMMGITLVSCFPCVPALTFCVCPHPLTTTRGGARFKVGWAAHIFRGCPGWHFGWFDIQGGFRGFCCPFAFMFMSVGHWWTGGGYSRCWAVCPGHFHSVHGPGWHGSCTVSWMSWQGYSPGYIPFSSHLAPSLCLLR